MEEKKKRWRPSLTAYRALESENAELKEQLSRISKEGGKEAETGTVVSEEEYNSLFREFSLSRSIMRLLRLRKQM